MPYARKRTGTWYAPRGAKMARTTSYVNRSYKRGGKTYRSAGLSNARRAQINSKTYSLTPQRFPKISRSAGRMDYATVRTFTNMVVRPLDIELAASGMSFRSDSYAFYPKLAFFGGFQNMVALHEQVKPISITVRAKIIKLGPVTQTNGTIRRANALNYLTAPGTTGVSGNVNNGSVMGPGCFSAEIRSVVDYDGKRGLGGSDKYEFVDYVNAGNTALSYINGSYNKTISQYSPRQYALGTSTTASPPLMDKSQFFPQHAFVNYNTTSQQWIANPNAPKFGGLNLFATSYDAVGNGFSGLATDLDPVLYVQYWFDLKCAFKGRIKNKEIVSIGDIVVSPNNPSS